MRIPGGDWGPSARAPVGFHSPVRHEDHRTPVTVLGPLWAWTVSPGWELLCRGASGPPGRGCSSFLWPASSRGTERLAQGPISCDVLAPWAWQGIGCLHLHCLGHASESQPLVSHRGRFSEGQAWRGEHHGLRPPQGASQAALLLALAVSSALPPRGNSGCDLGLPWHGAPKADKQSQPRLDERPLRAECCAHALTVTQPREGLLL